MTLKLVPPGYHQRNAGEVAIQNTEAHFLSVLTGTAYNFPQSLRDKLLPQAKLTLNLLRQANADQRLSAYAYLHGSFDFNKMPLDPMGATSKCTKIRATEELGLTIQSMDGTYIRHPNIIGPTIVTSS